MVFNKLQKIFDRLRQIRNNNQLSSRRYLARVSQNRRYFNFLFLIIIPALYIPVNYYSTTLNEYFPNLFQILITIISLTLGYHVLGNALLIKSTFQNENNRNALEYQRVLGYHSDIILSTYVSVITFIVSIITSILLIKFHFIIPDYVSNFSLIPTLIITPAMALSLFLATHMFIHEKGRNFSLELARSWLYSIEDTMTDSQKISHIIKFVENHNDHIETIFRRRINDIDHLCTLLILNNNDTTEFVNTMRKKFEGGDFMLLQHYIKSATDFKIQLIRPRKLNMSSDVLNLIKAISILVPAIPVIISIIKSDDVFEIITKFLPK